MPNAAPIRVLIADDHPVTREGISALLSHQATMEVVGEAVNGRQAISLYRSLRPDVLLTDLCMPEIDGTEAIRLICREDPKAHIVVFTTLEGEDDIHAAVCAGAKGFLFKDASRSEIVEAITFVHEGQAYFPAEVMALLAHRLTLPELSVREIEVLECMGSGKSNFEIATTLFISEGTVKTHVNNILGKLRVSDRTQAVTSAHKRGLVKLA